MPEEHSTPILPEPPTGGFTPEQLEILDALAEFLNEKWGIPPPPCPYCRITSWSIDPTVYNFRHSAPRSPDISTGVPVFLIICANCGHEVPLSVAITGLWEKVFGEPPDPQLAPKPFRDSAAS